MTDYLQPTFFRFGRDSIELVNEVKLKVENCHHILDLGAGCGIIGIELALHFKPARVDFVELQNDYREHILGNLKLIKSETESQIFIERFGDWVGAVQYDLIVCNPPYYLPGKGEASKDQRRGLARTFYEDGWEVLLKLVMNSLSPSGSAYMVIKNEKSILDHIRTALKSEQLVCEFSYHSDIVFLCLRASTRLNIK